MHPSLRFFSPSRALLVALPAAFAACNAITGAGDLEVKGTQGAGGGATTSSSSGASSTSSSGASSSGAGGASSTSSTSTSTSSSGMTSSSSSSASSGGNGCPVCPANQLCDGNTKTCVCSPGFVMQGGSCTAAPPGDPTTHTQTDVCTQWKAGHAVTEPAPLTASGADCDPGVLKPGAFVDTLTRINMFRWMGGLGPTTDDAASDTSAQECANLEAWWPFQGGSPHAPPANSKCYTPAGGGAAGQSNIAWGSGGPGQAIDQFMEDNGNATTLGHRRWILNPPLGPVGIGYWETGGLYGNAECLIVFGQSGGGPNPPWTSLPVAGFAPLVTAQWTWSFHGSLGGIPNATVTMLRVDDNTPLAVNVQTLSQGYGQDCISWTPSGWVVEAGKTYRVTVGGLGGGDVQYDVKPVVCN